MLDARAPGSDRVPVDQAAPAWSFTADVSECCSCEIPCSCNFGRPEAGTCHGTRLIQIRDGRIDGDELAGISFVVSFHRGQWTRIYVDDSLNEAQSSALDRLLPSPASHDYVQYESVVHEHTSADAEWSYQCTNGFRSVMRAGG